mmetsp:Transcript_20938/g.36945  ORF Transcript_20938/g.36945 Transcript_20938/m.36945 type:complete len:101 (-) Transcript_20938:339-641(-)
MVVEAVLAAVAQQVPALHGRVRRQQLQVPQTTFVEAREAEARAAAAATEVVAAAEPTLAAASILQWRLLLRWRMLVTPTAPPASSWIVSQLALQLALQTL